MTLSDVDNSIHALICDPLTLYSWGFRKPYIFLCSVEDRQYIKIISNIHTKQDLVIALSFMSTISFGFFIFTAQVL